jgi:hypothetical protein
VGSAAHAQDSSCGVPVPSGDHLYVECKLCDGDHVSTDCAEFDFVDEAFGIPTYFVAELNPNSGCDPTVDVRGLTAQLGMPHVYARLTTAGNSAVRVDPPRHRHIDADVDVSTAASCTDLEVILRIFYKVGNRTVR